MKKKHDISFLGRTVLFFRRTCAKIGSMRLIQRFKSSQKELAGYTGESVPREAALSYGFNIAKIACISALCVLLAVALIFCGGIFTYENVYYMFKDISYITDYNESRPEMLSYSEAVNNQDFAAFKGGLAAVSDSEIKFFTSTGRATLTLGSEYTDPKIVTGDSRALVYDSGKSSFAIYNSFICEYSESLDLPISSADMANNGRFAVVTRSKSYTTSVRIYESDFSLISEYSKNDYIVSAKLSPDGKYVAVLSLDAASGEGKTTLSVIKVGSDKLHSSVTLDGAIPYSCAVLSSDRIAVFLNDRVTVFAMNGKMISEYHYPEKISAIACSESGFTLLFNEKTVSGAAMIAVFDSNGKAYTPKRIDGNVKDVEMYGEHVYLLCEDRVVRVNALTGAERSVEVTYDDASLTVINDGEALLCTSASAYYLRFE